jgi:hypothetical protein
VASGFLLRATSVFYAIERGEFRVFLFFFRHFSRSMPEDFASYLYPRRLSTASLRYKFRRRKKAFVPPPKKEKRADT